MPAYDLNTLLLIHGNEVTDFSGRNVPIINSNVIVSSNEAKFGNSSLYFDGNSFLLISMDKLGLDFNQNWTLEWWEYVPVNPGVQSATFCMPNGNFGFVSSSVLNQEVRLFAGNNAWDFIPVTLMGNLILNNWTHRAICKNNNNLYSFENGNLISLITINNTLNLTQDLYIGYRATNSNSGYFKGYLDEIRVSNIARWTSNFTPPTEPYVQNQIIVTGFPSSLGEILGNYSFSYSVSNIYNLDILITEKIDGLTIRSFNANSGQNQTFNINITGLSAGEHTYSLELLVENLASSMTGRFSVGENIITIQGLPKMLPSQSKNFQVKYILFDSSGSTIFNVTNSVDSNVISSFTTNASKVNIVTIDISNLVEGYHVLYVKATTSFGSIIETVEFYVNKNSNNYISQSIRQLRAKINILNFNFQIVDEISGNVLDGNITEDANSDMRRSCDISMVVTNGEFNVQPGSQIFLDKYTQIYIGVDNLYTGETQWFNKGIYLIDQPNYTFDPVTSTLTFQGYDLMAKMTGLRNGYLEGIPTIIPQGSSIRDSMISTITQLGGFPKYVIEENPQTVPYDIQIDPGGTVYDILISLRDILPSWQIYFDEDGVFHYEPIPSGQNEPVFFYDDTWNEIVLSENINTDFSTVKNIVEVWGKTLNPAHYADATVSGSTYQLNIADVSKYRNNMLYGFTAPSIIENPKVQINSLGALPIVNEDGTNAVIPEADTYYVVKYQQESNNFLFMGYQQPYAVAQDENPDSPFYVEGPVGSIRVVLQGGEYDNIYTNDLALQRAQYELWKRTRLEDNVTLNCVPIYSLKVNMVVSRTLTNETEPTLFIIKTIATNLSYTGTQSIQMITYYPLYPDI